MEAMEIINTEEVIEMIPEEIVTTGGLNGFKVAGKIALGVAVGYGIYRGAKWVARKVKAKKEQQEAIVVEDCDEIEDDE